MWLLNGPCPAHPVHHDTELANENTRFFIKHALHDRADFVFVLNGESDLRDEFPDHLPNVRVIQRDNTCYDLGAHGEVLKANDKELIKKYDKFILMNGKSLRLTCWSLLDWALTLGGGLISLGTGAVHASVEQRVLVKHLHQQGYRPSQGEPKLALGLSPPLG